MRYISLLLLLLSFVHGKVFIESNYPLRNTNLYRIASEENLELVLWVLKNLRDVKEVRVFRIGEDVVVYVERYPILREVVVEGNRGVGETDIRNFLGLREGEPLIGFSDVVAEEALVRFYRDRGYVEAEVDVEVNVDEDGFAYVRIRIEEGELHFLGGALFEGAEAFTADRLLREADLQVGDVFRRESAEEGTRRLREFYRREGFLESYVYLKEIKMVRGKRPFAYVLMPGYRRKGFRDTLRAFFKGVSNLVSHPLAVMKALGGRGHLAVPIYRIVEGRRYEINFEGNRSVSVRELNGLIDRDTPAVDHTFLENLRRNIEELYRSKGFFDVKVDYTYREDRIVYRIEEGPRYRLVVLGRTDLDLPDYYDENLIEKQLKEVIEKLKRKGFLTARYTLSRRVDRERKEVWLTVDIIRGKRVLIKDLVLSKGPRRLRSVFAKYRALLPAILKEEIIDSLGREIEEFFQDEGYLEGRFSVDIKVEEDRENLYLTYLYTVETGPRYSYGWLITYGNEKTRYREIHYTVVKQDHFSKEAEEESLWNLIRSESFSGVRIEHFVDRERKVVHRLVEVREDKRGVFELSVGYNTEERLKLEGSLKLKNLFGVGIIGSLSASKSEKYETYEVSLSDRFLFSRKYFGDLALFRRLEFHRSFDLTSQGFSVSFGYRPTRWVSLSFFASQSANRVEGFGAGRFFLRKVGLLAVRERRDDPVNPRSLLHVSLKLSSTWGERSYYGVEGNFFLLREITPRVSFNLRVAGGLVGKEAPVFDRFFLGGLRNMRGYDFEVIGYPSGGRAFLFSRGELVFTIRKPFKGAVYVDAGSVGESLGQASRSIKYDAGLAVGIGSPVGFIRVDLAFPLSRLEVPTSRFRVYLSIGFVY
jgi:outer membrane protein insertion porin family